MIEIISLFILTIINKSLLNLFIFSEQENFVVEIENYKFDYLQDDQENKNLIFINQTCSQPNDLVQPVANFILSNKKRNLVDRFEKDNVLKFN